jgi:hypothetical protein
MAITEQDLKQYQQIIADHEAKQRAYAPGSLLWNQHEEQLRVYRPIEKEARRALGWPVCREPLCYSDKPLPTKPKPNMEAEDWACEAHGGHREYCQPRCIRRQSMMSTDFRVVGTVAAIAVGTFVSIQLIGVSWTVVALAALGTWVSYRHTRLENTRWNELLKYEAQNVAESLSPTPPNWEHRVLAEALLALESRDSPAADYHGIEKKLRSVLDSSDDPKLRDGAFFVWEKLRVSMEEALRTSGETDRAAILETDRLKRTAQLKHEGRISSSIAGT